MKIYLVIGCDFEDTAIDSAYRYLSQAERRVEELREEGKHRRRRMLGGYDWQVEEVELR